jgi:hypothetical protein
LLKAPRLVHAATVLLALSCLPLAATAQDTARAVYPCDGHIISAIAIHSLPPYSSLLSGHARPLATALTAAHIVTKPNVIRAFLELQVGQACTELRRRESERILRAQPFLAVVRVTVFDDHVGGVRIDVFTEDEISLFGGISLQAAVPHLTGLALGELNLAGQGLSVGGAWHAGLGLRDMYGLQIIDHAVAGRPYVLSLQGAREFLGGYWSVRLANPFFTDLQKNAWLIDFGSARSYVAFPSEQLDEQPNLDARINYGQIGFLTRLRGGPGNLSLVGASVSGEWETPGVQPILLPDSGGDVPDTIPGLAARYSPLNAIRINALLGIRDVNYLRVAGFDALAGEQDLQRGVQIGTVIGPSLAVFGTHTEDLLLAGGGYAGWASPNAFAGIELQAQARENRQNALWDDIVVGGSFAFYYKPSVPNVFEARTEYGLGLDQRLPFALAFADPRGGPRGFGGSYVAGGERLVERLEDRMLLRSVKGLGDFGLALFTDLGRMWAQGVPFGVNSSTAVGVGIGLLAALPARSKRTWRLDLAVPVTRSYPHGGLEIRFSSADRTAHFYVEPHDLSVARDRTIPTSIFEYPPR